RVAALPRGAAVDVRAVQHGHDRLAAIEACEIDTEDALRIAGLEGRLVLLWQEDLMSVTTEVSAQLGVERLLGLREQGAGLIEPHGERPHRRSRGAAGRPFVEPESPRRRRRHRLQIMPGDSIVQSEAVGQRGSQCYRGGRDARRPAAEYLRRPGVLRGLL